MVSIEVASQAGACYGVERALKMVKDAAEKGGEVQTLGPLIHNPIVVSDLERHGVTVADDVEVATAPTVVIRSHGVVPTVVERARERGLEVIDATCPYVKKVQHAAERLGREGYRVIVVGESGHPEVEGILGHAQGAAVELIEQGQGFALETLGQLGVGFLGSHVALAGGDRLVGSGGFGCHALHPIRGPAGAEK